MITVIHGYKTYSQMIHVADILPKQLNLSLEDLAEMLNGIKIKIFKRI